MHDRVHLPKEVDCFEMFVSAVLIRHPLAALTRIVEVQHRGNGIDSQTVDMELLQPVQSVGGQEVANLWPAEVEDVGTPIGVLTFSRVGVFVQRFAVEARKGPLVRAGSVPAPSRQ